MLQNTRPVKGIETTLGYWIDVAIFSKLQNTRPVKGIETAARLK